MGIHWKQEFYDFLKAAIEGLGFFVAVAIYGLIIVGLFSFQERLGILDYLGPDGFILLLCLFVGTGVYLLYRRTKKRNGGILREK